ncbi:MAG: shikimate dehydrogenase [Gemmatimonadetes bacterium]|nr:shikimate dehydrogenase [Gemmatimonadota bacterium]
MSASRPSLRRVVLLGHPVAHSLSAVFQNAAIAASGIAARYEAVDVAPAAFASMFASMRETDGAGNVTVPHKSAAYAACDVRTAVAERTGAVNTFWVEGGRIVGDNTDVAGVRAVLAAFGETRLNGARIALLGAGGAAAAVLEAVRGDGVSVRLWSRFARGGDALGARFPEMDIAASADLESACDGADVIINATPIGLTGGAIPVDPDRLPSNARVLDLVYRRVGTTPWVAACRAAGIRAEDGLTMLVAQGAAAFRRWFGREPDVQVMWESVQRARDDAA